MQFPSHHPRHDIRHIYIRKSNSFHHRDIWHIYSFDTFHFTSQRASVCFRPYPSRSVKMTALFTLTLGLAMFASRGDAAVAASNNLGYVLPSSGTASTTQFNLGSEFAGGTSCGMDGYPGYAQTKGPGKGPGLLYVCSA